MNFVSRWLERRRFRAAARRWTRINAEARAAGCKCGRPATKVTRYGGTVGGVPSEVWSCDEHVGINNWIRFSNDGSWVVASIEWRSDTR